MIKNLSIVGLLSIICSFAIGQASYEQEIKTKNTTPITKIEFHDSTFEWGELIEGEKIKNVFTFTNTGKEPLIISSAKGSCGCTVPMWPKEPIMPGESADLLVQFDSKGKGTLSGNQQSKRVSITANTEPAITFLTIKGKVFKVKEQEVTQIKNQEKQSINVDIDESKVLLYPNPTDGELNVSLKEYTNSSGSIEIYNDAGSKVHQSKVTDFGNDQVFNVADFAPGVYTVSIKIDDKNRIAKRFVIPE